jgi:hypothetical protein
MIQWHRPKHQIDPDPPPNSLRQLMSEIISLREKCAQAELAVNPPIKGDAEIPKPR